MIIVYYQRIDQLVFEQLYVYLLVLEYVLVVCCFYDWDKGDTEHIFVSVIVVLIYATSHSSCIEVVFTHTI